MKVWMPLYSMGAWGRFYGKYPFGSFYGDAARQYGYCIYQRRHTWHGLICIKEVYYTPTNPQTPMQQGYRGIFADAVSSWQNLGTEDKETFNQYHYPPQMSGYNRFLHYYLREHLPEWVLVGTFLTLTDTPSSYSGKSGKAAVVKETEDGLEFDNPAPKAHAASHKSGGADPLFIWGTFVFTISGALVVGVDKAPTLAPATAVTIDKVWIYAKTGPSGGVCTIDVNKNGTTIFTDQGKRPSIADGQNSDESDTPDIVELAKNDLLTIDVDAVNGAEDLTIHVRVKQYLQ